VKDQIVTYVSTASVQILSYLPKKIYITFTLSFTFDVCFNFQVPNVNLYQSIIFHR